VSNVRGHSSQKSAPSLSPLKTENRKLKTPSAFALIELLIVIAIIGILTSLLFPAVNSAIDAARKAQAKNDVVQIATAVTAYETKHGRLPNTNSGVQTVGGDFLSALGGSNAAALNPRQVVFIELQNARKGKSGITNGNYVDPWGGSYRIAFDHDYDNTIASAGTAPGSVASNLRKKVAVWNTNSSSRRAVNSWE